MARRRLLLPLALAAGALALPAASASAADCPGADTAVTAQSPAQARAAVLCIVNAERTVRGLNALTAHGRLDSAAQAHTDDMILRGYFEHTDPSGDDPGDRITAAGYDWGAYGENIAAGYRTPRQVMEGWMRSAGHCRNILDPGFTELGVGVAPIAATLSNATGTWTQEFGRPRGTAAPGSDTAPRAGCPYASLQGLGSDAAPAPVVTPASPEQTPAPAAGTTPPAATTPKPRRVARRWRRHHGRHHRRTVARSAGRGELVLVTRRHR